MPAGPPANYLLGSPASSSLCLLCQCMQSDGTVIFSGAKDGKLHMWDALSFKKTASWDMNKQKVTLSLLGPQP